ncbi:MAG: glycosyltransferase [Patescibacteria group bacterium]|nr:glycosyltransferase [Patescibacteria group bacterium]
MRIAMNVTREFLGGITTSNLNLLNFLKGKGKGVIGIELNARRHIRGATAFWHLGPEWFEQHIFNIHDMQIMDNVRRSKNLKELEKKYRPIIDMIKAVLDRETPDVLLLNGTYFMPWLVSIAADELEIPTVLRYAGVLSRETVHMKPKARKIFLEMERSFQKRVYSFIFPSNLTKKVVEEEVYKTKIKRYFVIPNPVNIPEDFALPKRSVERRIAAIGRWDYIKNFSAFFDIHKILKRQKYNHVATFVTREAKINGIPKSINRLAPMTPQGLWRFYTTQGLIISPSHFETFGNVAMEAAFLSIPVLVSDQMGCAEILKIAGLEKMVMPFDDLKAVAERAKDLCGQYILPKQLNNLRSQLDPQTINEQIYGVLREAARSI